MKMNMTPETFLENWGKAHTVLAFVLWVIFPGGFALNFAINGAKALPWDLRLLAKYGVQDVSVAGNLIFAIVFSYILMGVALSITGVVLGEKRFNWVCSLFTMAIAFAIVKDLAIYAEAYLWA